MADLPVPDSAMDTKSEESLPVPTDPSPLDAEEQALLDHLRGGNGGAGAGGPAAEESAAYAAAVADDSPVPTPPRDGNDDDLDPVFREPTP